MNELVARASFPVFLIHRTSFTAALGHIAGSHSAPEVNMWQVGPGSLLRAVGGWLSNHGSPATEEVYELLSHLDLQGLPSTR